MLVTSTISSHQHLRRYSKDSFERLAREAGLNIRDSRYFFHWLAASKLAVRAKERLLPTEPKPPAIPPPLVNRLLYPRFAVVGVAAEAVAGAVRKLVAGGGR